MKASYYFILLLFSLTACTTEKVDRSKLIDSSLQEKEDVYFGIQYTDCREELFEEINLEVDSIMFFLVQKMKGQNDIMPNRPNRPARLVDTISLEENPNK